MKPTKVTTTNKFQKQYRKVPSNISSSIQVWIELVTELGIIEIRKIKGYHDEPLKGKRRGQRSIRLSRSYRLIYEEDDRGQITILTLLEVHKHEY